MADTKISDLPVGTYNQGDYIVTVDVTTNPFTSKKLPLSAFPSGGGGAVPVVTSTWSTGGTAKNFNVSAGVNLNLTLTLDQAITVTDITVGGTALTGPFTVTGAFPMYSVAVAAGSVPSSVQTTGGAVSVRGLLATVGYSVGAGGLTINQAVPYTVNPSASFLASSYPYWQTSDFVRVSATVTGTTNTVSTTVSDGARSETVTSLNATTTNSYNFTGPTTDVGQATGDGLNGAPLGVVVPINLTVTAPTSYQPLIYGYTGITVPVITVPIPAGQYNTQAFVSGQTFTIAAGFTGSYWIMTPTSVVSQRSFDFTKSGITTAATANFTQMAAIGGVMYLWSRFDSVDSTGASITVMVN